MKPKRILIVSDFHITSGKNPVTGRWSPTEDFFWDEEFKEFLTHYSDGVPTTLIINGDLFDFLQVLIIPTDDEKEEFKIPEEEIDRKYGLQCSEACCEFQIVQMMNGHPVFFDALAEFLSRGHELKIIKGNHDIQLHWLKIQKRIRERLQLLCKRTRKKLKTGQIEFLPWFYYIPELLYVEHGNQFEPMTAFRNFLYPVLPPVDDHRRSPQIELDLSGFLVRYLTNRLEPVNPLADNIRPLTEYYSKMWKKYPFLMIETLGTALRFVLKAFRKARELRQGSKSAENTKIVRRNREGIHEQAASFAGKDPKAVRWLENHLTRFDERRATPTLAEGAFKFLLGVIKEGTKSIKVLLPLYLLTFIPDVGNWILDVVKGTNVTLLVAVAEFLHRFNLLHALVIVIVGLMLIWLVRKLRRVKTSTEKSEVLPDVSMEMRTHAEDIAKTLGVKFVTFGHTHYADTCGLFDGGRYFNTGTWMGIYEEQEQLYREAHQFTFLLVEGMDASLLRWNPDGKKPFPVVVVDNRPPLSGEEDGIVRLMMKALKL